MAEIQRWYDKNPKLKEVFLVLQNVTEKECDQFSTILYQAVDEFKKNNKVGNDLQSVGIEKLDGYYKAYNKRRWYDKNSSLRRAAQLMSIMPSYDVERIIDDFIVFLKMNGLHKIYEHKKTELYRS